MATGRPGGASAALMRRHSTESSRRPALGAPGAPVDLRRVCRHNSSHTNDSYTNGVAMTAAATPLHLAPADARGETVGVLLNRVAKAWRGELDRRLRPLGLTRVQWQALLV